MKRKEIIKHYKSFFGLEDMRLAKNDRLMIDWAENLIKKITSKKIPPDKPDIPPSERTRLY